MTKLQKLYSTILNLKELGLELGEDLLRQTEELEQDIIKNEILHRSKNVIYLFALEHTRMVSGK